MPKNSLKNFIYDENEQRLISSKGHSITFPHMYTFLLSFCGVFFGSLIITIPQQIYNLKACVGIQKLFR